MFILLPESSQATLNEPTEEEYLNRVNELIGDSTVTARIKSVSKWFINETVAERYSEGNMYVRSDHAVSKHSASVFAANLPTHLVSA
jgi:hypothetical protein